jgi:hypothetical protein
MTTIQTLDLENVTGGAGVDFNSIRAQAQQYCPQTAQRFSHVNPANVTRSQAEKMGNQCLGEMGSFKAAFARPVIEQAIDTAFPRR